MNRQVIPIDTSKAVLTIVRDSVTELAWRVNPLPANRGRGPGYRNGSNHNENQQDHNHPGMPPRSGMGKMTNFYKTESEIKIQKIQIISSNTSLVPTLCVGMPSSTLGVVAWTERWRGRRFDGGRPRRVGPPRRAGKDRFPRRAWEPGVMLSPPARSVYLYNNIISTRYCFRRTTRVMTGAIPNTPLLSHHHDYRLAQNLCPRRDPKPGGGGCGQSAIRPLRSALGNAHSHIAVEIG